MVKYISRFMVAFLAASATLASAQVGRVQEGWAVPEDVALYTYVAPTYAVNSGVNEPLNPLVTPPPQAGLTPIATSQTGRIVAGGVQCVTTLDGGTCTDAKFRTHANSTKVLYDDPIRNPRQSGGAHCHTFFGNKNVNAFSTYATLRTNNSSFAAGAELNATAYWFPCMIKGGKALKPSNVTIYYQLPPAEGKKSTVTPPGNRYVGGYHMDEADGTITDTLVANANAANVSAGGPSNRYQNHNGNGRIPTLVQYACTAVGAVAYDTGLSTSYGLRKPDGTDPWNGTCTTGSNINIQFSGPSCWDGVNLWSPNGYRHVIPPIWDNVGAKWVCPTNYYQIPNLQLQILFTHKGWADYGTWTLSSDAMANALRPSDPLRVGASFHTDWMDGWDPTTFREWNIHCIGAENNITRECNSSAITDTKTLIVGSTAPNGRFPQVDLVSVNDTDSNAWKWNLPANQNGPLTVHSHVPN